MISLFLSLALFSQDASAAPSADTAAPDAAPLASSTAPDETSALDRDAVLADINAYLNTIDTLRADFTQIAPNGAAATGELSMARPGRLRFEYAEPSPIRIIADGTTVAIEDRALETVDRIPLRSTPLWWLLKSDIDIAKDAEIVGMESEFGFLYVTLRDPAGEMEGELMLVFAEPSYELREWFVTDALGEVTRVSLNGVETGIRLNPRLFVIPEAENRRDSRRGR